MAFTDQVNACVSTYTIILDPHERLGPAGATLYVGNLLKRRPAGYACLSCGWRAPTRSRGCVRARRPRRGQGGAQKPSLHVPWRVQSRVCAGGVVGRHLIGYRRLLYRLVAHCSGHWGVGRGSPKSGRRGGSGAGLEAFYGFVTLVKHYYKLQHAHARATTPTIYNNI